MIDELEALAKEKETASGYLRVKTPHLTKGELYKKSGHLKHYISSFIVFWSGPKTNASYSE